MASFLIRWSIWVSLSLCIAMSHGNLWAAQDGFKNVTASDQISRFVFTDDFTSQYIHSPIEHRFNQDYDIKTPGGLSDDKALWVPLDGPTNFLFRDELGWIRFAVANESSNSSWIIEVDWPKSLFVSLDAFYKSDASDAYIKLERDPRQRFFIWPLELDPWETGTVVFRADAPERLILPIRVYRADRFAQETLYIIAGVSLFISVIVSLGIFNLFIGLRTRDETHLWYCLGQLSLGWFFAYYYGLDDKWYPSIPDSLVLIGVWVIGYFSLMGLTFFILSYLDFRNQYPRIYPFLLGWVFSMFICIAFYGAVDTKTLLLIYFVLMNGMLQFILAIAVYSAFKGDRLSLYFVLIWASVSVFLLTFNFQLMGWVERTLFTNHSLLFAFALEALLFSFALGERINSLIRENYEVETSAKVKSDFLAQMSHEIRTPMNAIIGMSQLMGLTDLEKKQQFYNNLVQSSAESLLCIINDILDFSKIEAGKLSLERISFSLNELLQGVLGIFYSHVKRTQIPLYCSVQPIVPDELEGDPSRLRQVLINLVGNAFKFTSEGYILLSVSVNPLVAGQVKFSIRDTGCGISDDAQKKLFSAFSQVDASTSRKYGGTGLGLAISKNLSSLMGGEIGVESKAEVGSCFYFTAGVLVPKSDDDDTEYVMRSCPGLFDYTSLLRVVEVWSRPEFCDLLSTHLICYNIRVVRCRSRQQLSLVVGLEKDRLLGVIIDEDLQSVEQLRALDIVPINELDEEDSEHLSEEPSKWMFLTGEIQDRPIDEICRGVAMCRWGVINRFYDELVLDKEEQAKKYRSSYQTIRSGLKILIAEDILTNQEVIRGFMGELGHEINIVDNGIRAVHDYQQHGDEYDLILMDCSMPEMDGFEATRTIRQFEKSRKKDPALIVALTAHAFSEHRQQCLDAGMDDHLSKPITLKNLVNTLNCHFPEA